MKNKPLFYFYAFSVILMMCYSNNMLFTWYIPRMVIIVLSIIAPLMYMSFTKCDNRVPNVLLCLLWAIIIMYVVFTRRIFSFISLFRKIGELLCVISVILLPSEQKKELLRIVTLCLTIIIAISLVPWILYLLGVPLPHSGPILLENGFHWVTNYYFFLSGEELNPLKFPRFRGMFIEAGQIATVCVFLYFANNKKLRLWQKITKEPYDLCWRRSTNIYKKTNAVPMSPFQIMNFLIPELSFVQLSLVLKAEFNSLPSPIYLSFEFISCSYRYSTYSDDRLFPAIPFSSSYNNRSTIRL